MALSGKLTAKQINDISGPKTLNDGGGLYLKIRESEGRLWFCRIRHPRTRKLKDRGMGLSRSQIYKLIAKGSFPEQIKIGPKISAWPEQTIDQWISRQIEGGVQ